MNEELVQALFALAAFVIPVLIAGAVVAWTGRKERAGRRRSRAAPEEEA